MARINDNAIQQGGAVWAADFIKPEDLMPAGGILDTSQFYATDSVLVRTTAQASSSATSISVEALSGAIPVGTILDFGGAGAKPAKLSAAAAAGATTLTVVALLATIASGDTARYAGDGTKKKVVQSGIFVGRTRAEQVANTGFGPWAPDDYEEYLVAFDNQDLSLDASVALLKPDKAFAVYRDLLPDYATYLNVGRNEVQTVTISGTLSAGSFTFRNPTTGALSGPVAYNGNLAAIQAALDTIYGATNTVAAGTIASFTITFAVALASTDVPNVEVIPGTSVTGLTGITIVETTKGGKPVLERIEQLFQTMVSYN